MALEASRTRLEASKRTKPPTPFRRIEELNREKTALQAELAKCHRQESANLEFTKEIRQILDRLQQAVFEWRRAQREINNDFKEEISKQGAETGSIKVCIRGRDV